MKKVNERNAGRKPFFSEKEIEHLKKLHEEGATITELAERYQVSRQTVSGYLNRKTNIEQIIAVYKKWVSYNREFRDRINEDYRMRMEFMCENQLCTVILVNFKEEKILIENKTDHILHRAFGIKKCPDWQDFKDFLEERCLPAGRMGMKQILRELNLDFYDPLSIIEKTEGRMAEDKQWIRITYFRPEGC